jgi:hypothetical protein
MNPNIQTPGNISIIDNEYIHSINQGVISLVAGKTSFSTFNDWITIGNPVGLMVANQDSANLIYVGSSTSNYSMTLSPQQIYRIPLLYPGSGSYNIQQSQNPLITLYNPNAGSVNITIGVILRRQFQTLSQRKNVVIEVPEIAGVQQTTNVPANT